MFSLLMAVLSLGAVPGQPMDDAGPPCVAFRGEARSTGYGYRHVVVLTSSCKVNRVCDVSSDVNPEIQKVTVAPNETREVVTFLESTVAQFTPRVACK